MRRFYSPNSVHACIQEQTLKNCCGPPPCNGRKFCTVAQACVPIERSHNLCVCRCLKVLEELAEVIQFLPRSASLRALRVMRQLSRRRAIPHFLKKVVEVLRFGLAGARVNRRTACLCSNASYLFERTCRGGEMVPLDGISERIGAQIVDVTVPQTLKEFVEVMKWLIDLEWKNFSHLVREGNFGS